MTRQQRIENNYFIRLGRQISGDPYLEPQLAMQLGRERFAGFRGMPTSRPETFSPLKGNIASVEDAIMGDDSVESYTGQGPYFDAESAMSEFADVDPLDTPIPDELAFLENRMLPSGLTQNELASRVGSMDLSGKSMAPQTMFDDELATGQLALDMGYGGVRIPTQQPSMVAGADYVDYYPASSPIASTSGNVNMGLSRTGDTSYLPTYNEDPYLKQPIGSQVTPMVDRALSFSEKMEKKLDPDATGDAFMLGGMLVNAHDKDRLMGDNSGSLAGVTKGGLKGAGLGYRVAGPEGALIGGAIGAGAGLLGAFDTTSPDPYTVETIQRGAGIAFPNMQSQNYYQGLI